MNSRDTTDERPEQDDVGAITLVDRAIESLRAGGNGPDDAVFGVLLDLRDDIDTRVGRLLCAVSTEEASRDLDTVLTADNETSEAGALTSLARRTGSRRPHRWMVLPVAGALVLVSTGAAAALSGSGNALHPLHTLIFGTNSSSDDRIGRDLASAQGLLDAAASKPFAQRAALLKQARQQLVLARLLLTDASSPTARGRLADLIQAAFARADAFGQTLAPQTLPAPIPMTSTPNGPSPQESGQSPTASTTDHGMSPQPEGESDPRSRTADVGAVEDGRAGSRDTSNTPPAGAPVPQAPEITAPEGADPQASANQSPVVSRADGVPAVQPHKAIADSRGGQAHPSGD